MKINFAVLAIIPSLFVTTSLGDAATFQIQLITDNDFAVYAGTSTTITRQVYQNSAYWANQITAASSFNFQPVAGETHFYVLAMGAGGEENLSGKINGINIVAAYNLDHSFAQASSPVTGFLTGYSTAIANNTLNLGTYSPNLTDVQGALLSPPTWSNPVVNTTDHVINQNPQALIGAVHSGFRFQTNAAVFYRFPAAGLNIEVPEPSSIPLLGSGLLGLLWRRRR